MAVQSLRGFRDFYPEDQARISYLRRKINETCALFGYEEFEGPALETFELYVAKSSEEIVSEQAFVFEDRGGDRITLRPELTPTLARMIAARQNQLAFPVRWWSFGRFWRYERPQKGRLREFYQWNLDLLGEDSAEADVEILEVAIRFLQSLGVTSDDVVFQISDRAFITELLTQNSISQNSIGSVFKLLDRLDKLSPDEQKTYALTLGLTEQEVTQILTLFASQSDTWQKSARLTQIMELLESKGLRAWAEPNLAIVRGFDYYTGMVFELNDRAKNFRALMGGGRYSNLVAAMGGQAIDGIGMGMGDASMVLFLESKGLLPTYQPATRVAIIPLESDAVTTASQYATELREQGTATIILANQKDLGKAMKTADRKNIPWVMIIGKNELAANQVVLKNLKTSDQSSVPFTDAKQKVK